MNKIDICNDEKILIVAPHPDDECIGVGGILCTYANQCEVIVLTDGALGQKNQKMGWCREQRKKEFIQEMRILGIDRYYMFQEPDGALMNDIHCLDGFDMKEYSKIFVTGCQDNHADHTAAYWCVRNAVNSQKLKDVEIYLYEVHNALSEPTHYLDISQCMEMKELLIRTHQTQIQMFAYDKLARATAMYRALQNKMEDSMIEVFSLVPRDDFQDVYSITLEKKYQKFKMFYKILTKWLFEYERDIIGTFLLHKNINSCVIYGYAELGKLFRKECEKHNTDIVYVIDQKVKKDPENEVPFFSLGQETKVDVPVIVTAIYDYENIKYNLKYRGYINIYSLADIITGEV